MKLLPARDCLFTSIWPVKSGHSRPLPNGYRVARLVRAYFQKQWEEVRPLLLEREITLDHWTEPMAESLTPLFAEEFAAGARRFLAQLRSGKAAGPEDLLGWADVFNPAVLEQVRGAAFQFAESTNETSLYRIDEALKRLRESLAAGLERGEALQNLTSRVQAIFTDPSRAQRIAATESSRAMHGGELRTAQESGLVKEKRWLVSADACPACLRLAGRQVPLDEPFTILPGGGPYARVMTAPLHPHCMCSQTMVLA